MWIHLLSLGLIDGASSDAPPPPPPTQSYGGGGGGGGRGLRELIERIFVREEPPETVLEVVAQLPISPEKVAKISQAVQKYQQAETSTALREAQTALRSLLARYEELEEEEFVVTQLLLV